MLLVLALGLTVQTLPTVQVEQVQAGAVRLVGELAEKLFKPLSAIMAETAMRLMRPLAVVAVVRHRLAVTPYQQQAEAVETV